jgi:hypothetical protein
MAVLVKCPACQKKVSDESGTCIHCGAPIKSKYSKVDKMATKVAGILLLVCILSYNIYNHLSKIPENSRQMEKILQTLINTSVCDDKDVLALTTSILQDLLTENDFIEKNDLLYLTTDIVDVKQNSVEKDIYSCSAKVTIKIDKGTPKIADKVLFDYKVRSTDIQTFVSVEIPDSNQLAPLL